MQVAVKKVYCSLFESCLVFARACARATQNTISLFGGVQKEKWYFGIPKRKRRLNRTLAWARSVLTSANARGSSAYDVTQTTRCDGVEVWTREAPSLTPVPRLRRRGVQGGDAKRPLLVGFQGVSEMTLGRFFFQAPPGFFLTKSKRNGVEGQQVLPALN